MKQTNNAIKFLMAQYRAIFQNAYFKGLATAAVVTMGLAAGQAQAASNAFDGSKLPTSGDTIFIDGTASGEATNTKFDAIEIAADKALPTLNIEISKGAIAANKVETGSKASATLTINNLTIKGNDENVGLSLIGVASSGDAILKANAINIETGTLKTTKATDTNVGKIEATSITIGKTTELANGKAVLDLDDASVVGKAIAADRTQNTDITLNNGALIKAAAKSSATSSVTLHADTLTINAGEIQTQGNGTNKTGLTINLVDGFMTGGKLTVKSGDVVNFAFADAITDNSLKKFGITGGVLDLEGKVTLSGSGVVALDLGTDKASIGKTSAESAFVISGGATLKTDLASAKTLASKAKTEVAQNSTLDLGASTLDLTDTNGLKLDANAATATSTIKLTDGTSAVKANEIILGADLTGKLVADTLTIKSGNATALNLTNAVLSANSGLTIDAKTVLKNDLALGTDSIAEINGKDGFADLDDAAKINALLAHSGTISKGTNEASALTVENDKSLNIDNGSWTNDVDLTIGNATGSKSGSLVIGKADTTHNTAASLKFNAGSKLTLSSGDITVGATTPQQLLQATLDLSELEADNFVIGTGNSNMTADNKGTIILSEDIANKIIATENQKLTTIVKTGGTLKVDGNLSLAGTKLKKSSGNAGDIELAGTLQANELTITGLNTELELGTATILAETLKLDGNAEDGTKLGSGNFVANTTLTATANDTTLTLGKGANIQLGNIVDGVAQSQGGNVYLNLDINAADTTKGKVTVATGNWTGKSVTLTKSGDFVVGGQGLKDNAKSVASFTATDGTLKIVDADSTVTIAKDSSATFAQLDQADGNITVNGTLTLNGKESGKAAENTLSYGVVTKGGDIAVDGSTALLHLGETAVQAISFNKDGSIKYATGLAEADPFAKNITLSNFGTLKLDFAQDTKLTKAQIKALRDELIKSQTNGYLDLTNVTISDVNVTQNADKGNRYEITYDELQNVGDLSESVVVENLKDATVTGIEAGKPVQGVVGNLEGKGTTSEITIAGATLNKGENGFATNESGTTVNMTVNKGGFLHLKNGGTANKITLTAGDNADNPTKLIVTDGKNTIDAVAGNTNTSLQINGNTTKVDVKKGLVVGAIETAAGSSLTVGQNANFKGNAKLAGDTSITGTLTVAGAFEASGNLTVSGDTTFGHFYKSKT